MPAPPSHRRHAMVRVPAMMATTGPPNRPAMQSTTERASKITPGIKTRGINMPTTQMPPNSTPETICPTRGFCRQSRMLTPCKKHSASNSATPLISSRNMGFRLGGIQAHHPGEATFCKRNSCARRGVAVAGTRGASWGASWGATVAAQKIRTAGPARTRAR